MAIKTPPINISNLREWLLILAPILLVIAVAFYITSRFVQPAPPDTLTMSTGAEGGAYHRYALQYREILKRNGITLTIKPSAGSLENLQSMRGTATADAGFVQGGTTHPEDSNTMLSLGRMFYEPVWVFHRLHDSTDRLPHLRGKRIAIGPTGSGTQHLTLQMLETNDVTRANSTFVELSTRDAMQALIKGEVDAGFFVSAADSDVIQKLLYEPGLTLMNFSRAPAYAKRYPFLAHVVLHEGVIDLSKNIPDHDIDMVAAVAMLAVDDGLHPALQYALTEAAAEVHRKPSIFNVEKLFPQSQASELPMSSVAEHYHKSGPPFFQRYLPFWLAVLAERLLILLIPILTILLPLIKLVPFIYDWRVRRRLWHWYDALKRLEQDVDAAPDQRSKHLAELARIDGAVRGIPVPWQFSESHFNLRSHVEYVKRRIEEQRAAPASPPASRDQ